MSVKVLFWVKVQHLIEIVVIFVFLYLFNNGNNPMIKVARKISIHKNNIHKKANNVNQNVKRNTITCGEKYQDFSKVNKMNYNK